MSKTLPTVVLVHGAWHGAWCWQRLTPHLVKRGFVCRTVDLPSVGARPGESIGLSADAATVRAAVAGISGPVILCAHSYGGMVTSMAAAGASQVEHLVYICAYVPESGQSVTDIRAGKRLPWVQKLDGGLTMADAERAVALLYGGCDPATQQWAMRQLRPQSNAAFEERIGTPAWKEVPSTYVVCANDQVIAPELQRDVLAPRTTQVIELDAGHSPFLSTPAELAEALLSRL
jgi:pimeloyl-ACP methyl ester carboxylesterase